MSSRGKATKRKFKDVPSSAAPSKVKKNKREQFLAKPVATVEPCKVMVCGDGDAGQLGLGMDVQERARPTPIPDLTNIITLVSGAMHTVCINSEYKVITFGCNDEGALGRDTSEEGSESVPGPVVDLPGKVVQISAGDSHSAALLEDGSVYAWGGFRDVHGVMGLLSMPGKRPKIEPKPIQINVGVKVSKIASGSHHIVLLGEDGSVYSLGNGEQGQLGRVPPRCTRDSRNGLNTLLFPAKMSFPRAKKFSDIWTGSFCTFAREESTNNIYVCGLNNYKQIGVDDNEVFWPKESKPFSGIDWEQISGGEHHSLGLDSNGAVYAIGRKEYGRLGLGKDTADADKPTVITTFNGTKCVDISSGSFASFAVTSEGKLYSWGMGANQLGLGDDEDKHEPTLVTGKHLEGAKVLKVSAGSQHAAFLVKATK